MNAEKLAKLQASVRIGGKGTPRRKVKKTPHGKNSSGGASNSGDDKKLQATLKKLNAQPIPNIDEVNMFRNDGKIIHFKAPRVLASVGSNTFCISGAAAQEKEFSEMVPGILNQLGADSLANLKRLAATLQQQQEAAGASGATEAAIPEEDEVPELVENFEEAAKIVEVD